MDKQMKDIFCKLIDVELDKISKLPNLNDATLNNLHSYAQNQGGLNNMDYSRDDGRSHLEAAMREARNEQEREEIRQLMARYHI